VIRDINSTEGCCWTDRAPGARDDSVGIGRGIHPLILWACGKGYGIGRIGIVGDRIDRDDRSGNGLSLPLATHRDADCRGDVPIGADHKDRIRF